MAAASRGYAPMRGAAGEPSSDERSPEEDPELAGPCDSGVALQSQRWRRPRAAVAALGGAACALGVGACAWASSGRSQATGSLSASHIQQLWWEGDTYGPCPDPGPRTGGVPRTPLYYTVAQAYVCLDQNKDKALDTSELPPGASLTDVSYTAFHELIRRNRDGMLTSLPPTATKVRQWSEVVLKWMPSYEGSMWLKDQHPTVNAEGAADALLGAAPTIAAAGVPGEVSGLYTYGAPGVVKGGQLRNPARADGCFPGLRTYTRGSYRDKDLQVRLYVADPVAYMLSGMGFAHPKQAVLAANVDNAFHSGFSDCSDGWDGPKADLLFWYPGHCDKMYARTVEELSGLLAAANYHEPTKEDDLQAVQVQALPGSSSARCARHPKCAAEFPGDAKAACCPDATGQNRSCCSEAVDPVNRFVVDSPFSVGDLVRVTGNETLLRQALLQVVYTWSDGMKGMLGQVFPVVRVPSPGIVGLPSTDGSAGGVWYFPVPTLTKLPGEEALLATPKEFPVPQRLLTEVSGLDDKRTAITKAVAFQTLATLGADGSDSAESQEAEDLNFRLVSHVMLPRNETGLTPLASLYQDPESEECIVSFAARSTLGYHSHTKADAASSGFSKEHPLLSRSLYTWWSLLAGMEPVRKTGFSKDDKLYHTPLTETINADGSCTLNTPNGHVPCLEGDAKKLFKYQGRTKLTLARNWCGIDNVEIYFADALDYLTRSAEYANGITAKISSCSKVTTAGFDVGGAFAALWSACVNSKLQEGQPGYEDYKRVGWLMKSSEGSLLSPLFDHSRAEQDVYWLKNKKSGKVLTLSGSSRRVHLGRGGLVLREQSDAGQREHWELTPEGFLRNKESKRCIGVQGTLGGSRPEDNLNLPVNVQDCQYGVKDTAQAWNFTKQGMLVNQYSGLCLSTKMKLATCPMTDQGWYLRSDGFLVNQLSGLCLDIVGTPGTQNGDQAVIWPCEYSNDDTDQRWTYTKEGLLKNMRSNKCLDLMEIDSLAASRSTRAVLWDCVETFAAPVAQVWTSTKQGFFQSRLTGKCLAVQGRQQTAAGSPVVSEACSSYLGTRSNNYWELMPSGEIVNRGNFLGFRGKCISESGGSGLAVTSCEQNSRQRWRITQEGAIKPEEHLSSCLGSSEGSLGIYGCNGTASEWYRTPEGFLVNRASGKCIDVSEDGTTVREDFCHVSDQQWTPLSNGQLKHKVSGRCLDVVGGPPLSLAEGAQLQLWGCQATALGTDQDWAVVGAQLKNVLSGLCVEAQGDQDGDAVVLAKCDGTRKEQRWNTEGGFLQSMASGKCADLDGFAAHTDGQLLKLWSCEKGGKWTDQTWALVPAKDSQTFPARKVLEPPSSFQVALDGDGTAGPAAQALEAGTAQVAGEFVSSGKEVYWVYRGYRHLVPPESDCSQCRCKSRVAVMEQTTIDSLQSGENYDCRLQSLADALDGFKSAGAEALASEQAAAMAGAGRFISSGRNVYWEYDGRKHEVQPGITCQHCGCESFVLISEEELAGIATGSQFRCEMSGIAAYGAHFMK